MKTVWLTVLFGLAVFRTSPTADPTPASKTPPPPALLSADEIIERLIRRTEQSANATNGIVYAWRRRTVIEDLDSKGKVEERRTKDHSVVGNAGLQKATLVRVNDKDLGDRERDREQRREADNREKYSRRSDRRGSVEIDETLIRKFRFQWLSNELVEGRWAHVLAFEPQPERRGGKVADRVIGSLGGKVWVDAEVYEVGRIEAGLGKPVSVGGFIAELSDLDFVIVRKPLPGGDWVNVKLESQASGRKLFDRFRGRMEIVQDGFEPASPTSGGGAEIGAMPAPPP